MTDAPPIPWLVSASKRARWLVGVSGGADSVALLHLLTRAGFRNLVVCHLDHRLRGRTSTGDARFVCRLAERLGHPCERRSVAVAAVADAASLETAARNARLAFFADSARTWNTRRLILAHHADDQAETVLWNLLRGSHGLRGMAHVTNLRVGRIALEVHRPLLDTRHAALTGWLRGQGLRWREDATNREPLAIRNRLRNEALPLLAEISGRDATASLAALAAADRETAEIVRWAVAQAGALDPAGRIHLPALRALPPPLRRAVVAAHLADHGVAVSRAAVSRCMELIDPQGPRATSLPGGKILRRRAGRLIVES